MPPTSFAQRRLWFLDRLLPGTSAFTVSVAARLRGDLEIATLERALDALVVRHEVLRTTFTEVDGEPMQRIGPPAAVSLPVREVATAAELDDAILAAATQSFDLEAGPLLRCELLHTDASHVLLVSAHHIVIDGWSLNVLFGDLAALYDAELTGEPAALPELTVQYGDFAAWQREHLDPGRLTADVAYWRETLAGAPARLDLPTTEPSAKRASGAGALSTAYWSATLADDVLELSGIAGATPYMTLLAAFSVLLGRYANATDLVVGSPVAGRALPEVESLVGCFINTVPLRIDLSGEPSFLTLLDRVRATALGAFEHQNLSFEHIVDAAGADRSAADTPVFQVLFSVNTAPPPAPRAGQVEIEFLSPRRGEVKYDLNLTAAVADDGIEVAVEYRTDRFGHDWIDRFLEHFRTLLAGAVADPERPVGTLPILTAAERRQLARWNDTVTEFPEDRCVHELVRDQAAATPDAVAAVFGDNRLTYGELCDRSQRLANHLRELGAGPGARVGLCLHRSLDLVVALLATLESGAAYLPLDPDYPADRLAFMLDDAAVDVVLTHDAARASVPPSASTVRDLDTLGIADLPAGAPPVPEPTDPAYVIYTSGSTGRPKGVVNTHRGIVNRLVWMQREFRLDHSDVVVQKTPYSFDVSVWEFLWPLLSGARLVLAEPGGHRDPGYLAELIRAEQVTTVHFVPSMLRLFLESADLASCPSVRRVLCSGEALPADLVRRFHRSGTSSELHNLYGPTEAAIDVSHWPCREADTGATVPIGWPIANTRLYVLDRYDQPVPVGVAGELVIGGVQVATGYVNRPELTARRFVPDPFAGVGTMYRTGDLAAWLPDGSIEFLGRLDHQVKLRGFRIELGEIESAVRDQPEVADAVVVAREDRLVCYMVASADAMPAARLRARLGERLPEHMVPATVVWLSELPLTANGKVDRAALPPPSAETEDAAVAARDGVELELIGLWEDLLGVAPIGVTDDFFALGGTSLQVVRLLSRVGEHFGCDLPVSIMFDGGATVERLAERLRHGSDTREWSPVVAISAAGGRPPLFCLPPAVGNALSYVDLARCLPDDQPVYGLQAAGVDAGQRPFATLGDAASAYAAAIRRTDPDGPYHLAGYCVGSVVALAVADKLIAAGDRVRLLIAIDGGPPRLDNGFDDATDADIAAWFAWELGRAADRELVIEPDELCGMPDDELVDIVLAQATARGVLPPDTGAVQLRRLLTTFTAGVRAVRSPELPRYEGPVIAFRAADESEESSPVNRFAPLAGGGLTVHEMPGDHYSMMRPPHVRTLASAIDELLTPEGTTP